MTNAADREWAGVIESAASGDDVAFGRLVPYTSAEGPGGRPAFTSDLAVAPDGTVWVVELSIGNQGA